MKNNFGQYGTSIVAHHYFRTDTNDRFLFGDNIKHVRYMSGIGASGSPGMLDYGVFDYKQPRLKQSDVPDFKDTQPGQNTPSNGQSVTGKGTYIIRGPGDLESILKNHESGQYIDLRNSQMSPEVLAAWQRGEPVEVNLEQLAPERVNLLAPLIGSVMQIIGGIGGAAYTNSLSKAVNDGLSKAADFVGRHGNSYSLNPFGGGEHIDVIARFRVLSGPSAAVPPETPPLVPPVAPRPLPTPKPPKDSIVPIPTQPKPISAEIGDVSPGALAKELEKKKGKNTPTFSETVNPTPVTADTSRLVKPQPPQPKKQEVGSGENRFAPYFVSDQFRDQSKTYIADKPAFVARLDDFHKTKNDLKKSGHADEQTAKILGFKDAKAMNTFIAKADNFVKQIPANNASEADIAKFESYLKDGNNSVEAHRPLNNNDIGYFVLGATSGKLHEGTNGILYSDPSNTALSNRFCQNMLNSGTVSQEENRRGLILLSFGNELKGDHTVAAKVLDPNLTDAQFSANLEKEIGRKFSSSETSLVQEKNIDKIATHLKGSKETAAFMERGPLHNDRGGVPLKDLKLDQLKFMGIEMVLRHKVGAEGNPIVEKMDALIGPQHITSSQEAFIGRAASLIDAAQIFNRQAPMNNTVTSTDWSSLSNSTGIPVENIKKLVTKEGSIDDLSKARLDQVVLSLRNSSGEIGGIKLDKTKLESGLHTLSASQLASTKVVSLTKPIVQAMNDSLPESKRADFAKLLADNPNMSLSEFIKLDGVKNLKNDVLQGVKTYLISIDRDIHNKDSSLRLDLQPELSQLSREIGGIIKNIDDVLQGDTADNTAVKTKFVTELNSSLKSVQGIITSNPNATINGKPASETFQALKKELNQFISDFNISANDILKNPGLKSAKGTIESIDKKLAEPVEVPISNQSDADTFVSSMSSTLDTIGKSLALNPPAKDLTIKTSDGKSTITLPITEFVKRLENGYEEDGKHVDGFKDFLLSGFKLSNTEDITKLADKMSTIHGLSVDGDFQAVRDTFALAAEASNNPTLAAALEAKGTPSVQLGDSTGLTNRLISGLPVKGLQDILNPINADIVKVNSEKPSTPESRVKAFKPVNEELNKLLSSNFQNFSDTTARGFLAIAERMLKDASPEMADKDRVDLTGIFDSAKKTSKSVSESMKIALSKLPIAANENFNTATVRTTGIIDGQEKPQPDNSTPPNTSVITPAIGITPPQVVPVKPAKTPVVVDNKAKPIPVDPAKPTKTPEKPKAVASTDINITDKRIAFNDNNPLKNFA